MASLLLKSFSFNCGGIMWHRDSTGSRFFFETDRVKLPNAEKREKVKSALCKDIPNAPSYMEAFTAQCALCERFFAIPTEYSSILETGLHSSCRLWDEGLTDGAEIRRLPTVEEASAIKFEDLRQDEKYVLMEEIRKMYYKETP